MLRILAILGLATVLAAGEAPSPAEIAQMHRERPVRVYKGDGRYMWHPAPGPAADPVPPLDDEDRAALAKPGAKTWERLVERFADRCGAVYTSGRTVPPALATWFAEHPGEAREFWLALDPRFDDLGAALAVLEELRAADPKRFATFYQLAVAMAVVWDQPDAVDSSRFVYLWAITPAQFQPRLAMREVWEWFSSPKRQGLLRFKPTELTWPILVHLVDLAITAEDAAWAVATYVKTSKDIAGLYPEVPYDYDKLNARKPKLGDRPYSLPNLRQFGGVCVDQAHFASEVAKALGIPAMKCAGEGRWGGAGHSWSGYLQLKAGRALLEFTGRYNNDFYYTGDVFDPQTRSMLLDRAIALLYDGSSGGHRTLVRARALARIASGLRTSDPPLAGKIAAQAVKANRYAGKAWLLLFELARTEAVPRKEALAAAEQVFKDLAVHPDITIDCLDDILALFPADKIDVRQGVYDNAYNLYRRAKRPDLQIQLRIRQSTELAAAGREIDSLAKALETVVANATEGSLVIPLVTKVVENSSRFRSTVKGFRIEFVKSELTKAAKDFPKKRGNEVSEAWTEFQRLVATL